MSLAIFVSCSLLALSPEDVLPAAYLCTNKIAADHENVVSGLLSLILCLLLSVMGFNYIPSSLGLAIIPITCGTFYFWH